MMMLHKPFVSFLIEFFLIISHHSGKALQASPNNVGDIEMWTLQGNENQLWFWDEQEEDILRNKMYPDKVLK